MSAAYIEEDLQWVRWIRYLVVALDLNELELYNAWISAQQDPKKFRWSSLDHAGTRRGGVAKEMMDHIMAATKGKAKKTDIWEYGSATGQRKAYEAKKWDRATGDFLGKIYVDEDGNEVDISGWIPIRSQHEEAKREARRVFKMES